MGIRYAKGAITLKASEDAFLFKFLNLNCFIVLDINKCNEIVLYVVFSIDNGVYKKRNRYETYLLIYFNLMSSVTFLVLLSCVFCKINFLIGELEHWTFWSNKTGIIVC